MTDGLILAGLHHPDSHDQTVSSPGARFDPRLALAKPLTGYPEELYRDGAAIITTSFYLGPLSRHKTLSFLPNIRARAEARAAGADEGIISDRDGSPAECTASNLFTVRSGTVITPPLDCGILPGVTRAEVLDICRSEGVPVEERRLSSPDLASADEIFLTNSLMGVLPVGRLDGAPLPAERPVAEALAGSYGARLDSAAKKG